MNIIYKTRKIHQVPQTLCIPLTYPPHCSVLLFWHKIYVLCMAYRRWYNETLATEFILSQCLHTQTLHFITIFIWFSYLHTPSSYLRTTYVVYPVLRSQHRTKRKMTKYDTYNLYVIPLSIIIRTRSYSFYFVSETICDLWPCRTNTARWFWMTLVSIDLTS